MTLPTATLSTLRTDGSATLTHPLSTIHCSISGPLEAPRRTELPSRCAIEVHIRPPSGPDTPHFRWLEGIVAKTLETTVLVERFPRMVVQVVLQIVRAHGESEVGGGRGGLCLLPGLLMASGLGLVDAGIPLRTVLTSTVVAVGDTSDTSKGEEMVTMEPEEGDIRDARSLHVFAFSGKREVLVAESVGEFDTEVWERACERAEEVCCGKEGEDGGMDVDGEAKGDMTKWLKQLVQGKVVREQRWRG